MKYEIINNTCLTVFEQQLIKEKVDITFLDPPFNQQKTMRFMMTTWTMRTIGK